MIVDGRRVEMEKTKRPEAESSRGWIQRPETNDDRPSIDGMMERVLTTSEVGNGRAGERHELADFTFLTCVV